MTSLFELNEQQKRQLIDAEVLLSALEQAEEEVNRYRGSMYWREQGGVLNAMMHYGVAEHFLVARTHALFAF